MADSTECFIAGKAWLRIACAVLLSLGSLPVLAAPQAAEDAEGGAHTRVTQYAKALELLGDKYQAQLDTQQQLQTEFSQIYVQFSAAGQESAALNRQATEEFRSWASSYLAVRESQDELTQALSRRSRSETRAMIPELRLRIPALQAATLNSNERYIQLQFAQQINERRRQQLLEGLNALGAKTQQWTTTGFQLTADYAALADVANVRSNVELKSARRVLTAQVDQHADNLGAQIGLAITLMRLDELDEAAAIVGPLMERDTSFAPLIRCMRAELLALQGQTQTAKRELPRLRPIKVPMAQLFLARTAAKVGEERLAATLWEKLTGSKEFEIIAHCHMALIHSAKKGTDLRKAAEEAQLAVDLSGADDWYCHLTSAICLAANGKTAEASSACEQAIALAIGDKKQTCHEIADQIKLGQPIRWSP